MTPVLIDSPRPASRQPARIGAPSRRLLVMVLASAVTLLVASLIAAPWITRSASPGAQGGAGQPMGLAPGPGMMGGSNGPGMGGTGMMGGQVWLTGDGLAVTSIAAARARAVQAGSPSGLKPGEIVQFRQNFYVELKDAAGASVTEVLVDPLTGAVSTEPGPAMMWPTGSRTVTVPADVATSLAAQWLQTNRPGETVTSVDAYPGYYTADTSDSAGHPVGMLSVNGSSGAVWYHTWHGAFIAREDS